MKRKHLKIEPRLTPPILLIDDDSESASQTASVLMNAGYSVTAEPRGDLALRLVRALPVRLVVSELYIPASEAEDVIIAMKADRTRIPRVLVVVHSRHTSAADVEQALSAGGDTFVPKPAPEGVLLREVERLAGPGVA